MNKIYHSDNIKVLNSLPDASIDLCYMDPPFFSQKTYKASAGSFDDKFEDMDAYINFLQTRIEIIKAKLKDTGSIYVHCDHHASHYIKVMLDKVFGYAQFRNEIVWCYDTQGRAQNKFSAKHDIILFYSKTKQYKFNTIRVPILEHRKKRDYKFDPIIGRYKCVTYKNGKVYTYYADDGKLCNDWWDDINALNSLAKERLQANYPTQKPIALLERILKASSNEGDIILDPFMGSGTTLLASAKLGRYFIGIDQSEASLAVVKKRLDEAKITYAEHTV